MPLFVGYPINYETACMFFRLPEETEEDELMKHIKDAGLEFTYVDKSQYMFGLEVAISNMFDEFVGTDDCIVRILQQKKKVTELIKKAGIDLSDFMLQPIGEEPFQRVSNPEPYLM